MPGDKRVMVNKPACGVWLSASQLQYQQGLDELWIKVYEQHEEHWINL